MASRRPVRAKIRNFFIAGNSSDNRNPWAIAPEAADDFSIVVELEISANGRTEAGCYRVIVTTPKYLAHEVAEEGSRFGRRYLLVTQWDWSAIMELLRDEIESIADATWQDVHDRLRRVTMWEYEDFGIHAQP
ncbi:Imm8 family immunity protein [Actinoplanes sp. NPDC051346]|uniref:Imm8 family immunity protein n=1 Tax=Actinoplanes sp. NPDC051346 TaxID=3155048 RepID=UPI0034248C10